MKKIIIFILFLCMFFVFGFRIRTSAMTIIEFEEAFSNLSYLGIDDNEEMNDFLNDDSYLEFLSDEPCIIL